MPEELWMEVCHTVQEVVTKPIPKKKKCKKAQYSCLENPMDRRAWWATDHGVTKSQTRLSDFNFNNNEDNRGILHFTSCGTL